MFIKIVNNSHALKITIKVKIRLKIKVKKFFFKAAFRHTKISNIVHSNRYSMSLSKRLSETRSVFNYYNRITIQLTINLLINRTIKSIIKIKINKINREHITTTTTIRKITTKVAIKTITTGIKKNKSKTIKKNYIKKNYIKIISTSKSNRITFLISKKLVIIL